jgi:hypothetical protein
MRGNAMSAIGRKAEGQKASAAVSHLASNFAALNGHEDEKQKGESFNRLHTAATPRHAAPPERSSNEIASRRRIELFIPNYLALMPEHTTLEQELQSL